MKSIIKFVAIFSVAGSTMATVTPDENGRFVLQPGLNVIQPQVTQQLTNVGTIYFVNTNRLGAFGKIYNATSTNEFRLSPVMPVGRVGDPLPSRELLLTSTVVSTNGRSQLRLVLPMCSSVTVPPNGFGQVSGLYPSSGAFVVFASRAILVSPTPPVSIENGVVMWATNSPAQ